MLLIDPRLLRDIKLAEGCKLIAYRDSRGLWTIGYGHELDQSIDWTGHEIGQNVAESLLEQDMAGAVSGAGSLPEWPNLDKICRQNAVIELVFNLGRAKWFGFAHCRNAIMAQDWQTAHDQLEDSAAAREEPARIERLADYLLTGQYPT